MKIVKPLITCVLLGSVSLVGCGGRETAQEDEQPSSEPSPEERERVLAGLPESELPPGEQPVCRNLESGDPWYPEWVYCCDNADRTRSLWTRANDNTTGSWTGNCASWGIRQTPGLVEAPSGIR